MKPKNQSPPLCMLGRPEGASKSHLRRKNRVRIDYRGYNTALRVKFLPLEMLFRPHSKIFNYIKKEGCFVQRPIHAP